MMMISSELPSYQVCYPGTRLFSYLGTRIPAIILESIAYSTDFWPLYLLQSHLILRLPSLYATNEKVGAGVGGVGSGRM